MAPAAYAYPYACDQPKDAEQDNLCIEREAATAARDQAKWALGAFLLGIISLGLIAATVVFTKDAAEAASKAAKAAEKALNDLERPWLYLESVGFKRREITGTAWDNSEKITPYAYWIDITFRNGGRMLAEVIKIEFRVVDKGQMTPMPDFSQPLAPLNFEKKFVLPGKAGKSGQFGVPIPAYNEGPHDPGVPQLVIYGRLQYRGLISDGHETGFTIEPWFIGGAWVTYGGDAYNYHK